MKTSQWLAARTFLAKRKPHQAFAAVFLDQRHCQPADQHRVERQNCHGEDLAAQLGRKVFQYETGADVDHDEPRQPHRDQGLPDQAVTGMKCGQQVVVDPLAQTDDSMIVGKERRSHSDCDDKYV
jgi:hypothetical protein